MSKEKQMIEELAKIISVRRGYGCNEQDHCDMSCQVYKVGCIPYEDAEVAYNAGYRKQSEGVWKFNKDGSGTCSECGMTQKNVWDHDNSQRFCGCCGAKM